MGNLSGKTSVSSSSDEDDCTDVGVLNDEQEISATSTKSEEMKTDAVHGARISDVNQRIHNINISSELINNIEKELDECEKISLVYLLYDNADIALKKMNEIINENKLIIKDWILDTEESDSQWKRLLEAIAVIKNYKLLKMLGFTKEDMNERFMPLQNQTSTFITRIKKYLYCMFESFNQDVENTLLRHIKSDLRAKGIEVIEFDYLEMYFLYFEKCKYINVNNYDNLTKHLKLMDYDNHSTTIKQIIEHQCRSSPDMRDFEDRRMETDKIASLIPIVSSSYHQTRKRSADFEDKYNEQEIYKMDPSNPGVCLILEYENFYTEPSAALRHLVIKPEVKVETREGTGQDSKRLKRIFNNMGFTVIYHSDKTHAETLEIIKDVAHCCVTNASSSFFLCILSHGVEGKIICCNSIPIEVETIKKLICSSQLEGKPKVLVLQSCQGKELQTVNEDLTTDGISAGPSKRSVPGTSDILEIWSTVPGYASIRSTTHGSWFIQSFCEVLELRRDKLHLGDMCVMVQRKVREKKWNVDEFTSYVMDCQTKSTFAKILWMPPVE